MYPRPARYLRTLRILHLALCAGVVLFGAVAVVLKQAGAVGPELRELEPVLLPAAGVMVMASLAASMFLFRRRLETIRAMPSLERKLAAYQSAQVVRWALAEGPAFLATVLMLLGSSPLFLVFAAAGLVYLIGSRPPASVEQASAILNLSWQEQERWQAASGNRL